jgi:peptidoglycan/xylan/chitin deacetylase (PgdA/CDA1 family)
MLSTDDGTGAMHSRALWRLSAAVATMAVLTSGLWAAPASAGQSRHAVAGRDHAQDTRAATCPRPKYGPQYYAPGGGKTAALTFDDGPGKTTLKLLRVLKKYRVPATFFNIGQNMTTRPGLVREEARRHDTLGNHTWNHPDMAALSASQQAEEMDRTIAEQRKLTGTSPCVFRPPYGDYNGTTLSLARHRRMAVWIWSVDTEDWKADGSASSYWVNRIVRIAKQEGSVLRHPVILMHNQPAGNPATVLALPRIIRYFRRHGYRFVNLSRT